ncbi:MAG: peptide antibiotic transporter SbmA [Bradyrhizobium sp.]|uniref:peptide antibiotic transporter SbmA n=1 Tax=Bradyrhizobium sp. TaxID=376 RepID=UPI001C29ACF6|nr:peptide antibiotic transporter SbmA [Bradyrhizobium sp.]MBU6461716.1 peptide antibiotic transporter SbmA [Pseudomonadota bacterium]MDE2068356.1 peptide antibiotic transporter SbmA [Bradyrhizobium sp.]MDE2242277.1 peptide antibiotic transporter SbmA [Bradyrhizobium sp.]MDE2472152.1 peptide antibiotic transporter SbmA [Bradyrhizobium sp.]
MFVSFFPRPKLFFLSAAIWIALTMAVWYGFARNLFPETEQPVGLGTFVVPSALWLYFYFALCALIFAAAWQLYAPHPWARWSILGSALILFTSFFQVEVSVAINNWYGPFYNLVQAAVSKSRPVTLAEFYGQILTFAEIALVAVTVDVITRFFISHYIFRWRTAMNDFYIEHWPKLRTIEGASQRVQEDTMRFASTVEDLGGTLISSVLTLLAFMPVLVKLSADVTELPLIGSIPDPLVWAAVIWSVAGTGALALIGIRLPGIEFFNQRVEAAYRKELVIGEDDVARAQPPTLGVLFTAIRKNYFRLYLNFMYFNVGRMIYLQTDVVFPYVLLAPTIVAGKITLGAMNQILNAFSQVRSSFQYLVNSWSTIVVLISIYQRLRGFEAQIDDKPLAPIETQAEPAS